MNTFHLTPEHEAELLAFLLSKEPVASFEPAPSVPPITPEVPRSTACPRCAGIGRIAAYYYIANGVCCRCGGSGKDTR